MTIGPFRTGDRAAHSPRGRSLRAEGEDQSAGFRLRAYHRWECTDLHPEPSAGTTLRCSKCMTRPHLRAGWSDTVGTRGHSAPQRTVGSVTPLPHHLEGFVPGWMRGVRSPMTRVTRTSNARTWRGTGAGSGKNPSGWTLRSVVSGTHPEGPTGIVCGTSPRHRLGAVWLVEGTASHLVGAADSVVCGQVRRTQLVFRLFADRRIFQAETTRAGRIGYNPLTGSWSTLDARTIMRLRFVSRNA